MDYTVYSIKQVKDAIARALALGRDQKAAERAAAQALGITVEAVREAFAISGRSIASVGPNRLETADQSE